MLFYSLYHTTYKLARSHYNVTFHSSIYLSSFQKIFSFFYHEILSIDHKVYYGCAIFCLISSSENSSEKQGQVMLRLKPILMKK